MASDRTIMMERQRDVFRAGLAATGLTFKQLAHRMGQGESTLRSWARGEAEMALHALDALVRVFPPEVVNLLLADGMALVTAPEGLDHDDFAAACLDFAARLGAARHPASAGGTAIAGCEADVLNLARARVGGRAGSGADTS